MSEQWQLTGRTLKNQPRRRAGGRGSGGRGAGAALRTACFETLEGRRLLTAAPDGGDLDVVLVDEVSVVEPLVQPTEDPYVVLEVDGGALTADALASGPAPVGPNAFGYRASYLPLQDIDLTPGGQGVTGMLGADDDRSAHIPLGTDTFRLYDRSTATART